MFSHLPSTNYNLGEPVATREAYGHALTELGKTHGDIIVMDGDMNNSTFSNKFKEIFPEKYFLN